MFVHWSIFQGLCVVCRASPHPSSLQHNLRWGMKLGNKSRLYYVTHTACGVRRRGTPWMGVLQESPSSHADWILLANAVENLRDNHGPAEIPLKSKYSLCHCHTEAPHHLPFPLQGLLSGLLFPSSRWRMDANRGLLIAWWCVAFEKHPRSPRPSGGYWETERTQTEPRLNVILLKIQDSCKKGNAWATWILQRVLGAQFTLLIESAMQIHNYCR